MISLSEQRKLAISINVIRSLAVINSVTEEFFIDSNKDYPKSAQNISSVQPIRNYINDLIKESNIDIKSIPVPPTSPQMHTENPHRKPTQKTPTKKHGWQQRQNNSITVNGQK